MFAELETKQHNLTLICYKFCHIFTRAAQRDSNLSRRQIVTLHEQSYLWCLIIKVLPVRWWMSLLASNTMHHHHSANLLEDWEDPLLVPSLIRKWCPQVVSEDSGLL